MNVTITPRKLTGRITPPPSKSQAHRLVIAAALAQGESRVEHIAFSKDILATLGCMEALGAKWKKVDEDAILIQGIGGRPVEKGDKLPRLFCNESGSTLRFLIPVALAVAGGGVFSGQGRLMERPQEPYFEIFREKGVTYRYEDGSLVVEGALKPGTYSLRGDVSSQFVTGLLYALPLLAGDSVIRLTSPLESKGYVDMTLDALAAFGIRGEETAEGYFVPGSQRGQGRACRVEADWSQAGFWYAANGLGNAVEILGMDLNSTQGDKIICPYYDKLCAPGQVELDVSQCPDLVPALAVQAALRKGQVTRIVNAARLRIKESDRLASVTQVLNALGADVREEADSLEIHGVDGLDGGVTVDSFNDHRIAMMAAVAAARCAQPVTVAGAECVAKSYPNFWEDYASLGGEIAKEE